MKLKHWETSTSYAPWPHFAPDEIEAAMRVLQSGKVNYWTGQEGLSFEKEFAEFVGCKHAIALSNGTVALELALYALGIGPGDEVITTSRTFIASASSVVAAGARPVIADVDHESQNLTAGTIEPLITRHTKAIITVHLAGWPCEMDRIMELARQHGLKVVEDCAQAQGAMYKGKRVGSIGDVAAFSFCQDKIMTTGGEGGMLTTTDSEVWQRAWSHKDHGKSYDAVYNREHPIGFRWLHESFGTNGRMTEMQAAIGRVELRNIDQLNEHRRRIAARYTERLSGIVKTPPEKEWAHAVYHMYVIRSERRDELAKHLQSKGIGTGIHYPVANHQQPAITKIYSNLPKLPKTEAAVQEILSLPIYGELPLEDVDYVCDGILEFLGKR